MGSETNSHSHSYSTHTHSNSWPRDTSPKAKSAPYLETIKELYNQDTTLTRIECSTMNKHIYEWKLLHGNQISKNMGAFNMHISQI